MFPFDGFAVLFACGFGTGADGCEGEVWVEGQEEDEALAYATCRSENAWKLPSAFGVLKP